MATASSAKLRRTRRGRRQTPGSTAEDIVQVTLRLIREHGFAAVSMRQVAEELGITATALYYHFSDKDALLEHVATLIYDSIPTPDPALPWTERLRQLVIAQQTTMLAHPGLARFILMHRHESSAAFRWIESLLEILYEGGLREEQALRALAQFSFLINPMTLLDRMPNMDREIMFGDNETKRRVPQLAERFPRLAEVLDHYSGFRYEDQFAVALDGVIAGLRAQLDETRPRTRASKPSKPPVKRD